MCRGQYIPHNSVHMARYQVNVINVEVLKEESQITD
jgi:hypothetical protein